MKQSLSHISAAVAGLILIAGFQACKSGKNTAATTYTPQAATATHTSDGPKVSKNSNLTEDFAAMASAYKPWTDVSLPVKVALEKPKKLSVTGTLTMSYGKAVSLSLKMLFVEVATVYADTDSVLIVSRPMKTYYKESLSRFLASSGLDISDLQTLLLGQAFVPGRGQATASDTSAFDIAGANDITGDGYYAFTSRPRTMPANVDWHFTSLAYSSSEIDAAPQLFALDIASGANTLSCTFAAPAITEAGLTATKMQIEGTVKKHNVDVIISGSYENARWNTGITPRKPSIPSKATRMSTEQVLKLINKL